MAFERSLSSLDDQATISLIPELRYPLLSISILSTLSFISTTVLFLILSYRMLRWQCLGQSRQRLIPQESRNDLSLGLSQRHFGQLKSEIPPSRDPRRGSEPTESESDEKGFNPFFILIYNLLLADLQKSLGLVLSIVWLQRGEIIVPSTACWGQGWLLTTGNLGSSGFLSMISFETYMAVVWQYRFPRWKLYIGIFLTWASAYGFTMAGILMTQEGREAGGYYVRAGAWCWVNREYAVLRFWLEYFWIFFSIGLTVTLYILILVSMARNRRLARSQPILTERLPRRTKDEPPRPSGHHPAFLVYPVIYIMCTAPLASGRVLAMYNNEPSLLYYGITGSFLAANGLLNVILWSSTILLSSARDIRETGLDRFSFMRTPRNRRFGNLVWVQGGIVEQIDGEEEVIREDHDTTTAQGGGGGRRKWPGVLGGYGRGGNPAATVSQESLQPASARMPDNDIRLEVVTTVVVEAGSSKRPASVVVTRELEKS